MRVRVRVRVRVRGRGRGRVKVRVRVRVTFALAVQQSELRLAGHAPDALLLVGRGSRLGRWRGLAAAGWAQGLQVRAALLAGAPAP